ncbi:hypothetical protein BCR34DRAFT_378818 [Clohesyomyces aquaticus]|uniref:SPT23/MGA2-like DNA-binding domain-containing protein n=1 Tax=Clohesyomyces aquaticus TaxID=1231657 RepID=A0A1Y2A6P6_9PLEO|nr:hypothetical protein BCR34DRAFT_378818 [Clohesyomyces aquaticus]
MDFTNSFFPDVDGTINPAALQNEFSGDPSGPNFFSDSFFLQSNDSDAQYNAALGSLYDVSKPFSVPDTLNTFCPTDPVGTLDPTTPDSAVEFKQEPKQELFDHYFSVEQSPQASITTSPSTDMIFSNANSPGDLLRDQSQTSSPDTTSDLMLRDTKAHRRDTKLETRNSLHTTPDAIHIPQTAGISPNLVIWTDKQKTRAETQIKVKLTLDPLDRTYKYARFPRKMMAKPKLLATDEEKAECEAEGGVLDLGISLVCATAIEDPEQHEQALRRARGELPAQRRATDVSLAELDKEDPTHPQNGGEVVICEGCKERERKRYDRKKKRAEDETEWLANEDHRVIMINEKEYQVWEELKLDDDTQGFSDDARRVKFNMRIACYCRHQEEKTPVGYRVIFTLKDSTGYCVAQRTSGVIQVTDDHKNKDAAPEGMPTQVCIPQQPLHNPYGAAMGPAYAYGQMGQQYMRQPSMQQYSQPPTPLAASFQSPISPIETRFDTLDLSGLPSRPSSQTFGCAPTQASAASFARHPHFEPNPISPTHQTPLYRPVSMDSFNYTAQMSYTYPGFASAPQSAVSTPLNLSRPASPSWDSGPAPKKKMHWQ